MMENEACQQDRQAAIGASLNPYRVVGEGQAMAQNGCSERATAKGMLRQRARALKQEALLLEALAASLPETMNPVRNRLCVTWCGKAATNMESSQTELPQYRSHKTVRAAKITAFRQNGQPDMPDLVLGEIGGIVTMLPDWHTKHQPHVGGYYVQYEDGYNSFSPAKAFEEGYTPV